MPGVGRGWAEVARRCPGRRDLPDCRRFARRESAPVEQTSTFPHRGVRSFGMAADDALDESLLLKGNGRTALVGPSASADDDLVKDEGGLMEVFDDTFVRSGLGYVWFATRGCPDCLERSLEHVRSFDESHWLCARCGQCWRVEHGLLRSVDPLTCRGCAVGTSPSALPCGEPPSRGWRGRRDRRRRIASTHTHPRFVAVGDPPSIVLRSPNRWSAARGSKPVCVKGFVGTGVLRAWGGARDMTGWWA